MKFLFRCFLVACVLFIAKVIYDSEFDKPSFDLTEFKRNMPETVIQDVRNNRKYLENDLMDRYVDEVFENTELVLIRKQYVKFLNRWTYLCKDDDNKQYMLYVDSNGLITTVLWVSGKQNLQ